MRSRPICGRHRTRTARHPTDPRPFEGMMASLMQPGRVIGRGLNQNGAVIISPETVGEGLLSISLEQSGFLPALGTLKFQQGIR